MCRYQKNYGKTYFPRFGILTMKILALAICDTRGKKIQYLDISLLAAGPLITVSLSLGGTQYYISAETKHDNSWLQIVNV